MLASATMEDFSVLLPKKEEYVDLPPGFRFHPTDEEIITYYLSEKVMKRNFSAIAMGEADLNKCEPWDLPKMATMGEKEWYFFCQRDRKYPTGMRTNRATESGYWKATGKDKEIHKKEILVGMKKTLVFYKGRAPKGTKTNWVMHEYRLEGKSSYKNLTGDLKDEWVVCRVFHKSTGMKKPQDSDVFSTNPSLYGDDQSETPTLPSLMESPYLMITSNPGSTFVINNNNNNSTGDYKGVLTATSTPAAAASSYITNMAIEYRQQSTQKDFIPTYYNNMTSNPSFYQHMPTPNMQLANMAYSELGGFGGFAAPELDKLSPLRRHCKVEQYSNQSAVSASPETSVVSKQEMEINASSSRCYDDVTNRQISSRAALDYDSMNYR